VKVSHIMIFTRK